MLERFTDESQQVVVLAREEAQLLRHPHIGTEHLFLGVVRVGDPAAGAVLHELGLTEEKARAEVVRLVGAGKSETPPQVPFTPTAHDALDGSLQEALGLGHPLIEPGHLLLAVMRQPDAVARRVLASVGAEPSEVRAEIVRRMGTRSPGQPRDPVTVRLADELVGDLGNARVDATLLRAMLEREGAVATWLRGRGVDEDALRRWLEP